MAAKKPGLYANINAKRKRIEEGAKERKARPGEADYPDKGAFKAAAKTAKNASRKNERQNLGRQLHLPQVC